jgi:hypothetical protein
VALLCDFHPDSYVRGEQAAAFLHACWPSTRPGRWTWCGTTSPPTAPRSSSEVLAAHPRLTIHYLPPYAPDLNAAEWVWCLAKHHRMANHTIDEVDQLHAEARRHLDDIAADQDLLRSASRARG